MKRIYSIIVLALALTVFNQAFAQTESRLGVTIGANYNTTHFKHNNFIPVDAAFGPMAGVTGEINISGVGFGLDASLLYSMRASKIHYGDHEVWSSMGLGNEMCRMHYIDIPINLKFKYHKLNGLENKIMPIVFAGPTFSFLAGKNLGNVNKYSPVSVLIHFGLGMELFRRWQIQAAYSFSVGQTLRTQLLDENIAKNRCWNVSATYYFK